MAASPVSSKSELLTPAQARRIFAYNRRLFDRYARRIQGMPWEEAVRDRGTGHLSLFGTLVHILQVHEVWICYILQRRGSDGELEKLFGDPERKPEDWNGFRRYSRRVWRCIGEFMDKLTPSDMRREVHAFWMAGRYTASDALMQTTFEQAHHIGEMIGAMWQQDVQPPDMTWIEIGRALSRR